MSQDYQLKDLIRKNALINAAKHDGKAQTGAIVGKILGERTDLRQRANELTVLISEIVAEVNGSTHEEQRRIVKQNWPETLMKEKTEEEKRLPPLPKANDYSRVVTRFSPNPDCVIHLGSARAIILCHDYSTMYKGKFILRFEDTDPKTKRPVLDFYDCIRRDLEWLNCQPDEEYIQSDRMTIYYDHAVRLLREGNAYVCMCNPDIFRQRVLAQRQCDDRNLPVEEHMMRWQRMLDGGYREGETVVRVKTDLNHPNPAVRDWPALRVIDPSKYPHPRVGDKYYVWPLYNLSTGVDDHLMGVTHIIRGKEHLTNQIRQEFMYHYFGWKYPAAIHYGRMKITGASLSKSKIVQGVREGLYKGWDDPRLATFQALKRRGITSEAIRKMIIDVGPKTQDVTLSWENLYAYNRKIIDPNANRYFFVQNPVEVHITGIPKPFHAQLPLHPENPEKGTRDYAISPLGEDRSTKLWVSRNDMIDLETGDQVRLMELFNIKMGRRNNYSAEATFLSESYEDARREKLRLIQWIPVGEDMPCEVVMPDHSLAEGIAESACKKLKVDDIIQFERFGFVRVDGGNKKLTTYYSHK